MTSGIDTQYTDSSVRLQDDLFRHLNGRWLRDVPIPSDRSTDGAMRALFDQAETQVRTLIEEAANSNAEPGTESQKVGDLFASFMDVERLDRLGVTTLESRLKAVAEAPDITELTRLLGEANREGSAGLFYLWVSPDARKSDEYIVYLSQGGLNLPDESYYREAKYAEIRAAYLRHIAKIAKLAGLTALTGGSADSFAETVLAVEADLAKNHWDIVACRDAEKTYTKVSADELADISPNFPWAVYQQAAQMPEGSLDHAVVQQPSFVTAASQAWENRPLDDWKAWLLFNLVHDAAPYLSSEIVEENFDFYGRTLSGTEENRERWKRGVSLVEGLLGEAVGKVYVDRHFPPTAKSRMDELVANLIEAYRSSITEISWMGDDTRHKALAKLDRFTPKIGYPSKWRDYSDLEILSDDLLGNVLRANTFEHHRQLNRIGGPIDREEWLMTPQTVNAYYHPIMNEIVFPAAILQPPFFNAEADDAANYGAIGAVIGHELGHGFDDQGSKYDGDGNLIDWWTPDDRAAFEKLTGSLIDQYEALVPVGLDADHHVNGALTIGENIGDLGGLGIAYKAYKLALGDGEAPEMDGLSGDQRFFLAWAQAWRGKARDAERIRRLAIDPHSPEEFRCNQIVKNLDAFYQAFDVREGDGMFLAPEQRVQIW
ncbi:M13-type metalloendopeptidase [Saxibacter everestensis]|uniref:M13-type metalloendopeptidase n=1 Tax=Saxibacter everestensis TaxID=2909229 RepID=A0ABY8QQI7_9MICO|nr:M13-type metalloendopeptidase [Brevibacteriaceae bacterium ZFBP1038]